MLGINSQHPVWPKSLLLLGAGKMGSAMLQGWLKAGLPGQCVTIVDPYISPMIIDLAEQYGCAIHADISTFSAQKIQEVIVLAIKPQMLDEASTALQLIANTSTMVISIMAGKTIANLQSRVPQVSAFIRAMPNTPAAVGRGVTGAVASDTASEIQKLLATRLLQSVGSVEWLMDEADMDAVTAVSGSGPAYVFYMVECLAKAGAEAGLAPDLAMRLARATIEGAGELLFQDQTITADILCKNVTSPGGTTAAALDVLMAQDGLQPLMTQAVIAAKRRATDLSG